ncbi:hypothetical protein [Bacillus massilinigeriensis]|uniref:hypothetical protein n=1 Tax=Bacillus massilionigeriensis TaxID=1805475 RepID=UPI0013566E88|nr:hypothetical protein [Bacillus massilionigeriensis]
MVFGRNHIKGMSSSFNTGGLFYYLNHNRSDPMEVTPNKGFNQLYHQLSEIVILGEINTMKRVKKRQSVR